MINDALEKVMKFIDDISEPSKMPKQAALDLLENIETELQGRNEALEAEIADEDRD